jgi:hypothetical protein
MTAGETGLPDKYYITCGRPMITEPEQYIEIIDIITSNMSTFMDNMKSPPENMANEVTRMVASVIEFEQNIDPWLRNWSVSVENDRYEDGDAYGRIKVVITHRVTNGDDKVFTLGADQKYFVVMRGWSDMWKSIYAYLEEEVKMVKSEIENERTK